MIATVAADTFADRIADEHGWTVLAEYGGHVRSELRYFLIVKTPVGVLEAMISKDTEHSKRERVADTSCVCARFRPERVDEKWPWQSIASLGYREIGARELSAVKDPDEAAMNVLRGDAVQVVLRGVILLTAAQEL